MTPVNCNLLIRPDEVQDKIGSILLAETTVESRKHMQTRGEVVAIAEDAFMDVDGSAPAWRPAVGEKIYFGKYAAKEFDKDQNLVIVKDVDVTVVCDD